MVCLRHISFWHFFHIRPCPEPSELSQLYLKPSSLTCPEHSLNPTSRNLPEPLSETSPEPASNPPTQPCEPFPRPGPGTSRNNFPKTLCFSQGRTFLQPTNTPEPSPHARTHPRAAPKALDCWGKKTFTVFSLGLLFRPSFSASASGNLRVANSSNKGIDKWNSLKTNGRNSRNASRKMPNFETEIRCAELLKKPTI